MANETSAQTHELKNSLAGYIGRALAVFCVDEIVIFNDGEASKRASQYGSSNHDPPSAKYTGDIDPCYFLAHLLSYLETPPHLRRMLFDIHPDLRSAGALPSLDMPHHGWPTDECRYREGVVVPGSTESSKYDQYQPPVKKQKRGDPEETSIFVNAGLSKLVTIPEALPLNTRVTLKFDEPIPTGKQPGNSKKFLAATPVAPEEPRTEGGFYWGYAVRAASSLSAVFTESPFDGGYDFTIGTSERGTPLNDLPKELPEVHEILEEYEHLMLIFGGLAGLEKAIGSDNFFSSINLDANTAGKAFDAWVNLNPTQGSRTIRTEEALWIALMGIKPYTSKRDKNP